MITPRHGRSHSPNAEAAFMINWAGFCRYTLSALDDSAFQKMLYDNGPLRRSTAICGLSSRPFTRARLPNRAWSCARSIPGRRYLFSLDADSEHVEGKFYVWTPEKSKPH